jgi:hypothetical protein
MVPGRCLRELERGKLELEEVVQEMKKCMDSDQDVTLKSMVVRFGVRQQ